MEVEKRKNIFEGVKYELRGKRFLEDELEILSVYLGVISLEHQEDDISAYRAVHEGAEVAKIKKFFKRAKIKKFIAQYMQEFDRLVKRQVSHMPINLYKLLTASIADIEDLSLEELKKHPELCLAIKSISTKKGEITQVAFSGLGDRLKILYDMFKMQSETNMIENKDALARTIVISSESGNKSFTIPKTVKEIREIAKQGVKS